MAEFICTRSLPFQPGLTIASRLQRWPQVRRTNDPEDKDD